MGKNIFWMGILTVILLVSGGCEQKAAKAAAQSNPPAVASTPAPQQTPAQTVEPNKVEAKPEPVKTEQTTVAPASTSEPNAQTPKPAESNTTTVAAVQPIPQETKLDEPNKQTAAPPKPIKAEIESVKSKPVTPSAKNSATHLCDQVTAFLKKYVDKNGLVDYKSLSRKKMETAKLLDQFKKLDRDEYNSWSKDDKLAFWINSYNLNLLKIIADNYPIESNRILRLFWPPNSIKHINGLWNEHKFIVINEEFTLLQIDQRFLQNEFNEPLALLTISYASASGTPLRNEAYCGQNLSSQFDDQIKKFLAGQNALKIDRENSKVYLSALFSPSWYGNQFIAKYGTDLKFKQQEPAVRAVLNFLTQYVSPQDIDYLETGNYTVEFLRYDWTLNDCAG